MKMLMWTDEKCHNYCENLRVCAKPEDHLKGSENPFRKFSASIPGQSGFDH